MADLPRSRGSIPPPILASLDTKLESEEVVLDALLTALARNNLTPDTWTRLHQAAVRDNRLAELAFAYESTTNEKRLKTLPAAVVAEFMVQAAAFFSDFFGDDMGSIAYLERALTALPSHATAFSKLEAKLVAANNPRKLADAFVDAAQHRPRADQAQLLRRAAEIYQSLPGAEEKAFDVSQQVLRLDPSDEQARTYIAETLTRAGKPRDVARILEQGLLVTDPPISDETARRMRARLVELYADELGEQERAVPHVEALLALEPTNERARRVAEQLLEVKGVAARAAAALAEAHAASGRPEDVARFLAVELEHTRGPKRRDILRRLGMIKQDQLSDPNGAYDAMEAALTLDPADDELRLRYLALAMSLGRQLDAARTLAKIATTAKDAPVRARLSADMAELFLSGGDRKRARTVFASALAMPAAPPDAILKSVRALADLYGDDEPRLLADVLERMAQVETDPEQLRSYDQRLAEITMGALSDPSRSTPAWRRLLQGPSRPRALEALEKIYNDAGSPADLAYVLQERAKDASDPEEARALLLRAAETLSENAPSSPLAMGAWREIAQRFGPSREVHARFIPLLEAHNQWSELATTLEEDARIAVESERAGILARAGAVRLQRMRDVPGAISAFRRALAADAGEKTSRAALEKLLAAGDHRAAAAVALEPLYRAEESIAGLLRVLEVKATFGAEPADRLSAFDEAVRASEASPAHKPHALDFAGRGLAEATASEQPIESWIERVIGLANDGDGKRRAAIFSKALGERTIDSKALIHLARHTGDSLASVGNVQGALAVFRRALAYDPSSGELITRVDSLLRDQGNPEERVALYRSALEREADPTKRRRLYHSIGAIERHELADRPAAIVSYRSALEADANDRDASAALVELYTEGEHWDDRMEHQEAELGRLTGSDERRLRAELAELAARHGQVPRAILHGHALLRDSGLSAEDLDAVERVANLTGDAELICAALERRAQSVGDPKDAVAALEKLGVMQKDLQQNPMEAMGTWKRAALLAEESNDFDAARRLYERVRKISAFDGEATERLAALLEKQEKWSALPELYAVLVESAGTTPERCATLRRMAAVLADRLGDVSGATDAAARAFSLDPRSSESLAMFERLAVMAGATTAFARAVDAAAEGADAAALTDLRLAKARVLSKDPNRHDDAAATYRALLEDASVDLARRNAAFSSFERLLESSDGGEARRADRRWLLAWRAAHTEASERVQALLAWARAEEALFADVARALEVHRMVLESDAENVEAASAVARLTLASGDVEGAIAALVERRDRSDGAARRALELEIASILIDQNAQLDDALKSLASLLEEAPDDVDALALAARLLRVPPMAGAAMQVLERACGRVNEPEVRATVFAALIETPSEGVTSRKAWFEQLIEAQKAQKKSEAALLTTLRAAEEFPDAPRFWERAEELARELQTPGGVADLFHRVLGQPLSPEDALEIGQRAVAFHEEWFDDPARVIAILERVLTLDPSASWAFDRLKLLFDAREQWDDLFALYDRAIVVAVPEKRAELLEDAAQTAKDFANHSDRAIGYLEQLLPLRPKNARIISSLERLYERQGRHRELMALLTSQLAAMQPKEARETRTRIAELALTELHDPAASLAVVEEILALDPGEQPSLSSLGDATSRPRLQVVELLQKILVAAPVGVEMRESMMPPPMGDSPPPRARAKRVPVRQRAAALLKEHYVETGKDAELTKVLEVELEAIKNVKERIRRHVRIAGLHVKLGNDLQALEHYVSLVTLETDVVAHRTALATLAERIGRFDRLAEVLSTAAEDCTDETLRIDLLMQAATVHEQKLNDATRAIELYLRILTISDADVDAQLAASRQVEPLLLTAGRTRERLTVLERISDLEEDPLARKQALGTAARLAAELGEHDRAIGAWEARLSDGESDSEALDGLVELLEQGERWNALIVALGRRATQGPSEPEKQRADRVRIARIHSEQLADPEAAILAWTETAKAFGPSEESTRALAGLLKSTSRWQELTELLEIAAQTAVSPDPKATLMRQLGDVRRERLHDAEGAIRSYEAALAADPTEEGAIEGLHALLEGEAHRASAVHVLLATYAGTDSWRAILDLTEYRLMAASDDAARSTVLRETAELAESRGKDYGAAFDAIRRAFLLDSSDTALESNFYRLAAITDDWRTFAETHRKAIDTLDAADPRDPVLLALLRVRLGEVLERLDDPRGALMAYLRAVSDVPDDLSACCAAVRVAGPNMRWDAAAKVVVQYATATNRLEESLFGTLEMVATSPSAWDGVTGAFAAAISEKPDLPPKIARDLESRIAAWHRDRRGDPDAAEAAFMRALAHDSLNADILAALAQLQRRAKGRPLVDSLLRLSQATGGDLDLLKEAAEIATSAVVDRGLAKSILERLMKLATERWLGREAPTDVTSGTPAPADAYVRWAIAELTRIHNEEGDAERIVDLLVEASRLPFDEQSSRSMRHQAARVAVDRLSDADRAIHLYQDLFNENTSDEDATVQLISLYTSLSRNDELLALRERQIEIVTDAGSRVTLRLQAARLQVTLGKPEDAIRTLLANLREEPRDAETVAELVGIYQGRHGELAALLADQAALAETAEDSVSAANFWAQAAEVAEVRLKDADAAITYHSRVVALTPVAVSFDALARLSTARQDYVATAEHLTQLRDCVPLEERAEVTLRLSEALVKAGREDLARTRLEEAISSDPSAESIRAKLAEIYRRTSEFLPLASLLASGAANTTDGALKLARLREAAELYRTQCNDPASAVPLLEQASVVEPEDRNIRLVLADTLGAAGRAPEALALLRTLVDGFGGRRPKERAPVHYHLARLALATGDRAQALGELEAATRIDPANAEILRALAELARDDAQLERAERSYRALLAVVRRQDDPDPAAPVVRSEVLLELSEIAKRQGENERASEILESALEAAANHPVEALRLENALRQRGSYETLVRALELRLAREDNSPKAAEVLFELADVLGNRLGRDEEAFAAGLRAVSISPSSPTAHASMLALARRTQSVPRYTSTLTALAAKAETEGDTALGREIYVRLGDIYENETEDFARAASFFEQAERLGPKSGDLLRSLERVYERQGNGMGQERILVELVELEKAAAPSNAKQIADALLRLAALRLDSPEKIQATCALISEALDQDSTSVQATDLLRRAADAHPANDEVLAFYERVARKANSEFALLDALRRRAELPAPATAALREAVALAVKLGERDVAESLLRKYMIVFRADPEERPHAEWALLALADIVEAKGDVREALTIRREAADFAEPDVSRKIRFDVARDAADKLSDPRLAASIFGQLLEEDSTDRAAWEPLLGLYRQTGETERLAALLVTVIAAMDDDGERVRLRLERARLLLEGDSTSEEGASELRTIIEDDPNQEEAANMLTAILYRKGDETELAALLTKQLDAAKDREDAGRVASLTARLGAILEKRDPAGAIEVYRRGLDWDANSVQLLKALLALLMQHGDATDRGEVMERLLPNATGVEAEQLALDLSVMREEAWDTEGAERAIAAGFKAFPGSTQLRDRLMTLYAERGDWAKLAEVQVLDASTREDGRERAELLREAAKLFRIELKDPERAATLLREARTALPADRELFTELVSSLTEAGNLQGAAAELTAAAANLSENDPGRAPLLSLRAGLRAKLGDHGGALYDLERAYALDPKNHVDALTSQLERLRQDAAAQGEIAKEAALVLRIAGLFLQSGRADAARAHLSDLLTRDRDNREALRTLGQLEVSLEHWDGAIAAFERLVQLEEGRELADTAMKLAEVCEKVGMLASARAGLERALRDDPMSVTVRDRLRDVYEKTGAHRELARMSLSEAGASTDDEARFTLLVRAATMLLDHELDLETAFAALEEAHHIHPNDIECCVRLADAHIALDQRGAAAEIIQTALALHKGRRSRDLALLHLRLARISRLNGDAATEMSALSSALDMDGQNGVVASELATCALEQGNLDVATKALRAVTMLKIAAPLPRAVAYQRLGEIAHHQGDVKKAMLLLKRAVDDDPTLESARTLLTALQTQ
jgi:tetratricopeptide (TPR) repeat protein